jgi:uncharacterized protein (TIGR03382 family)
MSKDFEFDSVAFADELQERVVMPMIEAQDILDRHSYLTRLYTTVSPSEMTRDPLFFFNAGLPDVSNEHTADAVGTCTDDGSMETVLITLSSGETITIDAPGENWWGWMSDEEWGDPASDEGAASSIALVGEEGAPVLVPLDKIGEIDTRLDTEDASLIIADLKAGMYGTLPASPDVTPIGDTTPDTTTSGGGGGDDGGCGAGSSPTPWWPAALALLGLLAVRRRRAYVS